MLLALRHRPLLFVQSLSRELVHKRPGTPEASWLDISIEDEGPGIPSEEYAKVFDRFFTSSDRSTANTSGVGLGLSIAKLIVERAGGRIWFDEAFNLGARCVIRLPYNSTVL
jgi:signal transduction histidine kinase